MSKVFSISGVPSLTTEQMVEVDRAMIEDHRIELIQMMENAGRPAAALDGLIGYSLVGAPFGSIAELIRWANSLDAPILALDGPSGLNATTGTAFDPTIHASATVTLALLKQGPDVSALVGELPCGYQRPAWTERTRVARPFPGADIPAGRRPADWPSPACALSFEQQTKS